ncbi:hypothetical protein KKH05_02285 [Patescibacteria group bacterium]|nr:hypothetical protein [Patescibacteria group bacterium]
MDKKEVSVSGAQMSDDEAPFRRVDSREATEEPASSKLIDPRFEVQQSKRRRRGNFSDYCGAPRGVGIEKE